MEQLSVEKLDGNNFDKSSSMFWEGEFSNGRSFELMLEFGSIILVVPPEKYIIGRVSDFPDVADVTSIFENWVETNPEEI